MKKFPIIKPEYVAFFWNLSKLLNEIFSFSLNIFQYSFFQSQIRLFEHFFLDYLNISYRNQSIDLLYDIGLRHERVNGSFQAY